MAIRLANRFELLAHADVEGKVCAEIGVLTGEFSIAILDQNPAVLHLIDPWQSQDPAVYDDINNLEQRKFDTYYESVCKNAKSINAQAGREIALVHRVYSHQFTKSSYAERNKFDFVYLDGNHSFAGVLADLFGFYPLVKPGGWICGHDCYNSTFIGVEQAVIMFCKMTGHTVDLATEEQWGSFGIRIKD